MTTPPLLTSANLARAVDHHGAADGFMRRTEPRHCAECGCELLPHERGRVDCDGCCRLPDIAPEVMP